MKSSDLAYAAGIIDGEGCIKIFRVKADYLKDRKIDRYQLQVQVDMVSPTAVEWLCENFGGRIYDHKRKNNPTWNDSKRWYIVSQQAGKFLRKILPYMKIRKPQAELGIEFVGLPPKDPKKREFWERNKLLNKRGKS